MQIFSHPLPSYLLSQSPAFWLQSSYSLISFRSFHPEYNRLLPLLVNRIPTSPSGGVSRGGAELPVSFGLIPVQIGTPGEAAWPLSSSLPNPPLPHILAHHSFGRLGRLLLPFLELRNHSFIVCLESRKRESVCLFVLSHCQANSHHSIPRARSGGGVSVAS